MATICAACGEAIPEAARFCPGCGAGTPASAPAPAPAEQELASAETVARAATPLERPPGRQVAKRADEANIPTADEAVIPTAGARPDQLIGTTVAGRFKVISMLGAGGMGTVYRAEQTAVNRPVVLKFLHAHLFSQPDLIERFHREALAASKLTCPNTIVLYDFGEAEAGTQFMAMEYLEGQVLTAEIRSRGGLPPLRAIAITLQVLASLEEAHDKGIVHRDLKPDNIMLVNRAGTSDFVKVLDFGIAKLMDQPEGAPLDQAPPDQAPDQASPDPAHRKARAELLKTGQSQLTQQGAICGSPGYMAPEQVLGHEVDHRADIYAVGVILYQMIAGSRPFKGSTVWELMQNAVDGEVEPLTKSRPDLALPRPLDQLILRCLRREPGERPQSAGELAAQLRALTPAIARQHQEQERALLELAGIKRRWPRWLTLGVALLLALGLLGGLGWLALGPDGGEEGAALAPGDRLFVSASSRRVPAWVARLARPSADEVMHSIADDAGATAVIRSRRRQAALDLARAAVVARMADVPSRFDPATERVPYQRDLQLVHLRVRELEAAAGKPGLLGIETWWAKLAVGQPDGQDPTYSYDLYAHMPPLAASLARGLRQQFAGLRYDRYSFLADEATRARRCAEALAAGAKVREAIDHLPKKKPQKKRLRFILGMRLKPCLGEDARVGAGKDAGGGGR